MSVSPTWLHLEHFWTIHGRCVRGKIVLQRDVYLEVDNTDEDEARRVVEKDLREHCARIGRGEL